MAKRNKDRRNGLMVALYKRVGAVEGYRVMLFIACWGLASQRLGRPLENVEEYADWWKVSRSQAFREQARYRRALPEFPDPNGVCDWLKEMDAHVFEGEPALVAYRVAGLLS